MKQHTAKWQSPSLGREMELRCYGDAGTPILGLPTRGGSETQWEEFGLVDALSEQLDQGYNQLFCVSSIDEESFLNEQASPQQRIIRNQQFEAYITDEVIPRIEKNNKVSYLIVAGLDLGGYHAINMAIKHPELFDKAIGISGVYNIKPFFSNFYDDNIYYDNPMDYVPNISDQQLLKKIRKLDLRLVSYTQDEREKFSLVMSNEFHKKFITHELDIWDVDTNDEWNVWPDMLKTHVI